MARPARLAAQGLALAVVLGLLALLVWRVAHDSNKGVSQALKDGQHPTAPAFDLRRLAPALWVTRDRSCVEANDRLAAARHYPLLSRRQEKLLSRRDAFEQKAAKMVEYPALPLGKP